MAAAVADWRVEPSAEKIKKDGSGAPQLDLVENPDILAELSLHSERPRLLIGFAAETENLIENASAKLEKKGADWIVANDVSSGSGVMGGTRNRVHLVTADGVEDWPEMSKAEVAERLVQRIADALGDASPRIGASPDVEQAQAPRKPREDLALGGPLLRRLRQRPLPDGERKRK
jgi:phosphopantothenoylcysteine decarboxylase/phosphopantothenate--cysteine ligase